MVVLGLGMAVVIINEIYDVEVVSNYVLPPFQNKSYVSLNLWD